MSKWEWKKLKDICEIEFGTRVVRKKDGGSIYPVYGGGGATFKMDSFNREDCLIVSRFAMSPQCTRIVKGKFFLNDSGLSIKSKDLSVLSEQYLNSIILGINDDIYALGRGAAQRNLNVEAFKELSIPIPPLSEQKRIVKFLDEEFSKIDTLKTNAETNLKNAKELFETTLEKELNPLSRHSERSEESSADLPSGWEWKKMEDICEITSSKRVYQSEWQNKGIPFLRISDFVQLFENKKEIDAELFISPEKYNELKMNNQVPEAGDILITARGTLGTCYIVKPNDCFYFQDGMITWLKNISNNIHPSFITYLFKNSTFRRQIDKNQSGSTVAYLSISMLKKFVLPLPPLSVQKEIVARLDKLSENVKRLEANYKQIIDNCDELKKTTLKQTFKGGN